jgi:cytochrome c-type biogenesis protein CcmH/NrfG
MRLIAMLLLCLSTASSLLAATAADHIAAGKAAIEKSDAESAAEAFEKAVALEPKNAEYHFLLGTAYGQMARKASIFKQMSLAKKTKESFEAAVSLDPKHTEAHNALLQYFLLAPSIAGGGEDKALAQAAKIKNYDPFEGRRAYARIYQHQKKHDLARKEMVEAVREQPKSPKAHYFLGNAYMNEKNWAAAQHEYEYAIGLDATYMPPFIRLGQLAALSAKDFARGEDALRKYLAYKPAANEPSHAAAWYWLGQIQEKTGRKAEAKASYTNAQKLAPGDKDIAEALKRVA